MNSDSATAGQPALPKLLLGDDHHLILDALQAMMKNDFSVLAVDNSQAFIEAVQTFRPDIGVLDVSMPGGDGFMTARKVLERNRLLPIVFLSMYSDSSYVEQAARLGAKAYLSKLLPAQELMSALRAVLTGETFLASSTATENNGWQSASPRTEITTRQREVLRLIARGCSAKEIATQLNISVRTAEFHRAAIMQKLGLRSTAQMTRYAIANNIT